MSAKSKQELAKSPQKQRNMNQSEMALESSINTAIVIEGYQKNLNGPSVDIVELIRGLRDTCKTVRAGDLSHLESMLIGQAKALETMFTSLARRSQEQDQLKHYATFLTLALKAQSQSRATIQAVVDLKYPRQVSFVKQANISNGPQQVNNATDSVRNSSTESHAKESQSSHNKLFEDRRNECAKLDARATSATGRRHQTVETVGAVNGSDKRRGQS